jgi:sugar (pentulose or hexulose) kinase
MEEVAALPLGEFSLGSAASETFGGVQRVRAAAERGALAVEALLAPARAAGLPLDEMWLSGPATGATVGLHTTETHVPRGIRQMRADLLGVPVVVPRIAEAAAAGAAAIAGVGAGIYASLREAADVLAVSAERIDPDPGNQSAADSTRARYARGGAARS